MAKRKVKQMPRRQQKAAMAKMRTTGSSSKTSNRHRTTKSSSSSATANQPYKYNGYTLHTREVTFKHGHTQRIYYFCKHKPKSGVPSGKPDGYTVGVNKRTGLPYLKKSK